VNKLISGNEAFALGDYHAGVKVASAPFMAAFDEGREEVSSADI
jgi:pyruvate/2-oxoacid:ferredoxin oxidoreductase alpha subunit